MSTSILWLFYVQVDILMTCVVVDFLVGSHHSFMVVPHFS